MKQAEPTAGNEHTKQCLENKIFNCQLGRKSPSSMSCHDRNAELKPSHRKHAATWLQKMVSGMQVRLQHALINKEGPHGLRDQDIHLLPLQIKVLYFRVQHCDPLPKTCIPNINVSQRESSNGHTASWAA